MKLSLNWLREYVDIPKNITPQKLGALLTLHSVEVEEVIDQAAMFENMVVGKIFEIKKHPNADKLKLVRVDIGDNKIAQVVCGGSNLEVDMLVAFAKVDARVRWHGQGDLITLAKANIRGEESEGMICAACETGLGEYQAGDNTVMNLNLKNIKAGTSLANALGLDDVIIDIDNKTITHRPDLWGHLGVAREVAAILRSKVKGQRSKVKVKNYKSQITNSKLQVEIENTKLCPRYMGVVIDGVKIMPSPEWMQNRLKAVGMRPINNIVDITNYVMLEMGQPLHAFDYNKIAINNSVKIVVKTAKSGEIIKTLDKNERKLDTEMLVITDAQKPIAIAGVMGGANSEVDSTTTKIVLEAATFEPVNNRQTAAKLGLRTEAVMRYEKSLDPNLPAVALQRILGLIQEIIPTAQIASQVIDKQKFKLNQGPIILSTNYVQSKIGMPITAVEISRILISLGFSLTKKIDKKTKIRVAGATSLQLPKFSDTIFKVMIPSWRATKDVSIADDLVEEVARMYGFDKIKPQMPLVDMTPPKVNQDRKLERQIKNILSSLGFDEVYNYSFISEKQAQDLGVEVDQHIKILNSLSSEHSLLRRDLLAGLFKNIKDNLRYFDQFNIFEIGLVFHKNEPGTCAHPVDKDLLPCQDKMIGGVVIDRTKSASEVFYQVKTAVVNLLNKIQLADYQILPDAEKPEAKVMVGQKVIGKIFVLDKTTQANFDINDKVNCGIFELNFEIILSLPKTELKYQQLNKFPEVKIDLAILCSKQILWYNIETEIKKIAGSQLKQLELFDVYEGENISSDKKSLAMHLSFGEVERTMEMVEVEVLRDRIVAGLREKFGAEIR